MTTRTLPRTAGQSVPRLPLEDRARLIERFAPEADVRERHEIVVRAPADVVLETAETLDLLSIPLVRWVFRLRALALGAPPPKRDDLKGLVASTKAMGWRELARQPGRQVVMGAAVQPWLAEPVFEPIPPDEFLAYRVPERVKIVWTLEAEPIEGGRTRLRTETRVEPTDENARLRFRRYWRFARFGIVLIRLLALPEMRRTAERRTRDAGRAGGGEAPLLERYLPTFDAAIVRERVIDAPAEVTFGAIASANLVDPLVRSLFAVRELPARLGARLRGGSGTASPRSVTVSDFLRPGSGMTLLAWRPGAEVAIGSVGRFWERSYGHRPVEGPAFADFQERGYAKLAMDLRVMPREDGRSLLRYEARTATTDDEARRRFRRYWMLIRPGVWLVMGRALALIGREAEERATERDRESLGAGS